jgi:hypothetical protein
MTSHRLVHGVVHDLPDQVMETLEAGGPDVHARPLTDRVETLKDLDVLRVVVGFACGSRSLGCRGG